METDSREIHNTYIFNKWIFDHSNTWFLSDNPEAKGMSDPPPTSASGGLRLSDGVNYVYEVCIIMH